MGFEIESVLQASQNDTIRAILRALDLAGPGEAEHAERVAVYAVATGECLGLSDEDLVDLRRAALLHDSGKIAIDRDLLNKLGELTDDDIRALQMHAAMCDQVLGDLPWLQNALPMIRHHHERWDGKGYPDGLSQDAIPLGARIIGVAETFDHIAFGSYYKEPVGPDAALKILQEECGKQFDERVVRAFLEIEPLVQPLDV
ncbi:MAG: HD domain-containing protein [Armatimonadetes bacterium]|nr:HD domain-containing protein [Armatimonadota bacterium]